ncbi:YjeF family domain-containing protein [Cyphellophora europaea CBS 101466]|uniref:Enhancer of mRNA-decapping protein 3 n=1 Tax=Cyphellophora europaea (strain CBS 101466) TaxID=1220924 RepID=W2S8F9_CYPE1|nr:YjeF family domain-containing protein [Cyphellophora europaea CBS 101466]ETN44991.1 YjeF family domain-containing protein [Cyphellophora europaea CBS 101466]
MASEFIGYTILVTLSTPPNAQIQGVVSNVVDQKLHLHNVTLLWNGQRLPLYTLDATNIADVEVAPSQASTSNLPTPTAAPQLTHQIPGGHPPRQPLSQSAFVDPAILSYNKPVQPTIHPVSPIMIADGPTPSPMSQPGRSIAKQSSVSSIATTQPARNTRRESEATAILTEPFDALALSTVNTNKKSTTKKHKSTPSHTAPGIIDIKDIHGSLKQSAGTTAAKNAKPGKGKGWRNTPLLDERTPRRQRGRRTEDANGWATEDATDIQDLGDFDFAGNLSKFDKRQVFDDLRKDDAIPDDDRLVSFNRVARPGTNGGRNLHFTENVLDGEVSRKAPPIDDQWKSEAGETELEEELEASQYSSSKGSRRANSRHPLPSRKASVIPGHVASERTASPRPLQRVATSSINGGASVNGTKASFRLPSNKPCHCVSPLQMLEIEQLCTTDLGLSEDMLSENAGRSIAEAVLKAGADVKTVVFLIGNHKSGARSVVAARHLRNRRLRVTVILLGGEREESVLESVRRQLNIYKKGGGWVERWDEYQSKLSGGAPQPDIIVDAIMGIHVTPDELRTDDLAAAFEMTRWASRTENVLSVDVPSGMNASSGYFTHVDNQLFRMSSARIVCLGAPKTGLLQAMGLSLEAGDAVPDWEVCVADVGISTVAWQRHGSRRRQGVEFSGEWVVPVRFVAG